MWENSGDPTRTVAKVKRKAEMEDGTGTNDYLQGRETLPCPGLWGSSVPVTFTPGQKRPPLA